MRNDLVPVPQFRIGLVNHFVQVAGTTHVTVCFNQTWHGELIGVINDLIAFRDFDFFTWPNRFDFAVLDQDRTVGDRFIGACEDLADVHRNSGSSGFLFHPRIVGENRSGRYQ